MISTLSNLLDLNVDVVFNFADYGSDSKPISGMHDADFCSVKLYSGFRQY